MRQDRASPWVYENVVFCAFVKGQPRTCPVYHFQSQRLNEPFFMIKEAEKNERMAASPDAWTHQGVAFYAYPENAQPGLLPVHRLLSRESGGHLYASGERERGKLVQEGSGDWIEEGVAWYAYEP